MSDAFWVALFGFLAVIAPPIIYAAIQFARSRGVQISAGQEAFIRDAAAEGIAFAEEMARGKNLTPADKLAIATGHARAVIDRHRAIPTPDTAHLSRRVEAQLPSTRPSLGPSVASVAIEVTGADAAKDALRGVADEAEKTRAAVEAAMPKTTDEEP